MEQKNVVTFFIDSPGFGGSEIDVFRLISFLIASAVKVNVVLSTESNKLFRKELDAIGIDIDYLSTGNNVKNIPKAFLQFNRKLPQYSKSVCVVWSHHLDSNRWLQLFMAIKKYNFLIVERSLPTDYSYITFNSKLTRPIKSFVASRSLINIVCAFTREKAYQNFIRSDNTRVIPTTRDVEKINKAVKNIREKAYQDHDLVQIITIGRLDMQKDPATSIQAIYLLKDKLNVKLTLVGDGELLNSCKAQVEKLGIKDNVRFVGYQKDPITFLTQADIFVFSSLLEGLPGVLIEAMAAEIPCIASNIPGNNELITHNETGLLFSPQNSEELADSILWMVANKDRAEEFKKNALERVRKRYNTCFENSEWLNLLNKSVITTQVDDAL